MLPVPCTPGSASGGTAASSADHAGSQVWATLLLWSGTSLMHGNRLLYSHLLQSACQAGLRCGWASVCAEGVNPHQGWRSAISESGVNELPVLLELAGPAAAFARWRQQVAESLPAEALFCTGGSPASAGERVTSVQIQEQGAVCPPDPLPARPPAEAAAPSAGGSETDGWLEVRVLTRTDAQLQGQPAYAWASAWLAGHGAVWQAVQRGLDGFAPGWELGRRSAWWRAAPQPVTVLAYGPACRLQPALPELAAKTHGTALVLSRCVQRWA
ncbi:MAG: hypothetical protein K6T26_01475 [Alicyclobacillus sp.]|nr:hypothetical protein [Alicyclobacillus sp.]